LSTSFPPSIVTLAAPFDLIEIAFDDSLLHRFAEERLPLLETASLDQLQETIFFYEARGES